MIRSANGMEIEWTKFFAVRFPPWDRVSYLAIKGVGNFKQPHNSSINWELFRLKGVYNDNLLTNHCHISMSRGAGETEKLKANVEEQLSRLLTQLQDLEDNKEDLVLYCLHSLPIRI